MPFNLKIGGYTLYGVIDRIDELKDGDRRQQLITSLHQLFRICWSAKIDVVKELVMMEKDPFDGLEEDLALKKKREVN